MSWLVLHTRKLSVSSALIGPGRETIAMVAPLVGGQCVSMVTSAPEVCMAKLKVGRKLSGTTTGWAATVMVRGFTLHEVIEIC